jgi:two-component system KDP operon response regulator KdpE
MTNVLLIDDEPEMVKLIEMALKPVGIGVTWVPSSKEALASEFDESPSVILLDVALADEDGLEVLPKLKGHEKLSQVPVVIFTVHPSRRAEAFSKGADGFLAKPFHTSDLVKMITQYVKRPE